VVYPLPGMILLGAQGTTSRIPGSFHIIRPEKFRGVG